MMENKQNHNLILKLTCIITSILRHWKSLILVVLIGGCGFDIFKSVTYAPQYSASLKAVLKLEENNYTQLEEAVAYIKTLNYVFNGQVVNNYIKEQLNTDDLKMHCNINSINDTNVVNIQLVSSTKKQALYGLANLVEWYQDHSDQYHFSYELQVLEKATLNEIPINQNSHIKNLELGAVSCGLIYTVFLFLRFYLENTIKTPDDIQHQIDCRLFSKVPKERKKRGKKFWVRSKKAILISSLKTSFQYKEAINKLSTRVEESAKKHGYKTILVTSTLENEGKSSIAANLALSLAKNDHTVLLIDADIRKPSIHKIFECSNTTQNLNNYLEGNATWDQQVTYLKENLFLMCAKQDLDNASELLGSTEMANLIKRTSQVFDYVIIDTSPTYGLNEPLELNEMVDASLLVIKQDEATVNMINETINRLVSVKNNLIGCIYNASVADFTKQRMTYGYRYGYNRYTRNERGS